MVYSNQVSSITGEQKNSLRPPKYFHDILQEEAITIILNLNNNVKTFPSRIFPLELGILTINSLYIKKTLIEVS